MSERNGERVVGKWQESGGEMAGGWSGEWWENGRGNGRRVVGKWREGGGEMAGGWWGNGGRVVGKY